MVMLDCSVCGALIMSVPEASVTETLPRICAEYMIHMLSAHAEFVKSGFRDLMGREL